MNLSHRICYSLEWKAGVQNRRETRFLKHVLCRRPYKASYFDNKLRKESSFTFCEGCFQTVGRGGKALALCIWPQRQSCTGNSRGFFAFLLFSSPCRAPWHRNSCRGWGLSSSAANRLSQTGADCSPSPFHCSCPLETPAGHPPLGSETTQLELNSFNRLWAHMIKPRL